MDNNFGVYNKTGANNRKIFTAVLSLLVVLLATSFGNLKVEAAGAAATYASIFDASFYAQKYPDLAAVFFFAAAPLLARIYTILSRN